MKIEEMCDLLGYEYIPGRTDTVINKIRKDYEIVKNKRGDYTVIRELTDDEKIKARKRKSSPRNTPEEIKERYTKKGLVLLNFDKEYHGSSKDKLSFADSYGYKYFWNYNNIKKFTGNIKAKVSENNPYTMDNIKLWLSQNGYDNVVPLRTDWSEYHPFLICKCNCGNEYRVSWGGVLAGKISRFCCDECKSKIPSPKRYSFDFVKSTLKDNGLTLLDNEYKGNNDNLTCINEEGYKIHVKFTNVLNKNKESSPYIFSSVFNEENYIYNVNNYFKINNIDCKALWMERCDEKYNGECPILHCRCSCGREFETTIGGIKVGQYRCQTCTATKSNLETKVEKWLESKHIEFEMQKKFDDLKDKQCLRFDFYLPKYNCCIEVDGEQHNQPISFGMPRDEYFSSGKAEDDLMYLQLHDKMKDEYCKNNGIKLIRIPQSIIEKRQEGYKKVLYDNLIKK